tara:strand:- start:401 stop:664 length:264 start_codon:yes stop_codon:yes gene_type:complete
MSCFKDIINRLCPKNKNKKHQLISDIVEYKIDNITHDYECIICLEKLSNNEVVSLIKCGHMYHTACLYTWFLKKEVCPLCDQTLNVK